jgi:hypothetical protein
MYILIFATAAALVQSPVAQSVVKPGTIAIVAADSSTTSPTTEKAFTDAVQRTLLRTAFLPLPGRNHSLYVAKVEVSQTQRGVVRCGTDRSDQPGMAAGLGSVADFAFGEGSVARTDSNSSRSDCIATQRQSRRVVGADDHGAR